MPFYPPIYPTKEISSKDSEAVEQQDTPTTSVPTNPGIWETCLAKASTQLEIKNIHLVVLGSQGSGKSTLVQAIVGKQLEQDKKGFLLEYSYSPPDIQREFCIHIWQLREATQLEVLKAVLPKEEVDNLVYIVCINISKPHLAESDIKKWTVFLRQMDPSLGATPLGKAEEEEIKTQESSPSTTTPNSNTQVDTTNEIPILFVGTQADLFSKTFPKFTVACDKFKTLMAYIRRSSYELRGSTFVTARGQLVSQGNTIRSYLRHLLFPLEFTFDLEPFTPSLEHITKEYYFIPSTSDSVSSILQSLPNSPFSVIFPQPSAKKNKEHKSTAIGDENFLKFLYYIMESNHNKDKEGEPAPGGGRSLKRNLSIKTRELRAKVPRLENLGVEAVASSFLCQALRDGGGTNKKDVGNFYKTLIETSIRNPRMTNAVLLDLAGVDQS